MKQALSNLMRWMACASTLLCLSQVSHAQAHFDARDGWRSAYVLQTISASAAHHLVASANDCRTRQTSSARQEGLWALVRYRRVPGDVYRIVPVAPSTPIAGGRAVYVNVNRCEALNASHLAQG